MEGNLMYDIVLTIQDGENEYGDHIYFFGTLDEAALYASSYIADFWGYGECHIENDWVFNSTWERAIQVSWIGPYTRIAAMTTKGAFNFEMEFRVR
jgi:hypothetical protein